jgi:hypothetical protein
MTLQDTLSSRDERIPGKLETRATGYKNNSNKKREPVSGSRPSDTLGKKHDQAPTK